MQKPNVAIPATQSAANTSAQNTKVTTKVSQNGRRMNITIIAEYRPELMSNANLTGLIAAVDKLIKM